jgi:polyribonucleotide nucleotidyltransferase
MERALEQARVARIHLLGEMEKSLAVPRETLPETVPKMRTFEIPSESIGKVIGPGGKQIRSIIEDFALENMDVGEEGKIQLSGFDAGKLEEAEAFVKQLIGPRRNNPGAGKDRADRDRDRPKYQGPEPVEGQIYKGKVTGVHNFGVFVEILPGAEDGSYPALEGMCHVSELATERVRNCEAFMKSMGAEELEVMYQGLSDKGKHQLSRKAVLEEKYGKKRQQKETSKMSDEPSKMSDDEIDVIAQAIEGISG